MPLTHAYYGAAAALQTHDGVIGGYTLVGIRFPFALR
jgi:hypothetical protein